MKPNKSICQICAREYQEDGKRVEIVDRVFAERIAEGRCIFNRLKNGHPTILRDGSGSPIKLIKPIKEVPDFCKYKLEQALESQL